MECHTSEDSKDMIVKLCTSKGIASVEVAADPVGGGVEGVGHGPSSPVSRSLHCSVACGGGGGGGGGGAFSHLVCPKSSM